MNEVRGLERPQWFNKWLQTVSDNSDLKISQNQAEGLRTVMYHNPQRPFKRMEFSSTKEEPQESDISPKNLQEVPSNISSVISTPVDVQPRFEYTYDDEEIKVINVFVNNGVPRNTKKRSFRRRKRPSKRIKLSSVNEAYQESEISPPNLTEDSDSVRFSATSFPSDIHAKPEHFSDNEDSKSMNDVSGSGIQSDESRFDIHKLNKIVYYLGIDFIQQFVRQLKKFQVTQLSPFDSVISTARKMTLMTSIKFEKVIIPICAPHPPIFFCRFRLRNHSIVWETADNMIEAQEKCAASAVDILIRIAHLYSFKSEMSCFRYNFRSNCSNVTNSYKTNQADMIILRRLGRAIPYCENIDISQLVYAMKSLNIDQCIMFKKIRISNTSRYEWKFFYKNLLLSSVSCGKNSKTGKNLAIKAALYKLRNLSNYEIRNGELTEKTKNELKLEVFETITLD